MKKEPIKPAILHTREAMEAEATAYAKLKLRHVELLTRVEQKKLRVDQEHELELNQLVLDIELKFAAVQNYCATHRRELLPDERARKSFDTLTAVIGFRDTPPAVEKNRAKETWGTIALRLYSLCFTGKNAAGVETLLLDCSRYVRDSAPEVNKEALLADRAVLTEDQLQAMGLKFTTEEHFYITPKSNLIEGESRTNE